MNNKNACIISKFIYENDTRLQQQVSILHENNFNIDVICQLEEKRDFTLNGNINIYGVSTPGEKDTISEYIWNTVRFGIPAFLKLQRLALSKKFDIIIVHTLPELLIFVAIIQKIFGSKIILDVRDTSVELFDSKWRNDNRKLLRKVVIIFANLSCFFANKILIASPGFKDKLIERQIPEEKLTVVFNAADSSIFKFDENRIFKEINSDLKLIYHGSIADRFGLDIAVEAVYHVCKEIPNTNLKIFGFYDKLFRLKIEEMITKYELSNNIQLCDRESLENIYLKILDADIGIVPYKDDFFMQLAFSTKLFEYVSSGIPVVTSRLKPAESIFSNDSLFYVNARDPKELAEKIIFLCKNPDLRNSQVKKAFDDYSQISDNVMKERFIKVIKSLIN